MKSKDHCQDCLVEVQPQMVANAKIGAQIPSIDWL